ncbi:MAG: hypothetical protein P8J43_09410, partial [Pirellulales bacterium]|nr:hypothetical protein [Pirellulales bacterium]
IKYHVVFDDFVRRIPLNNSCGIQGRFRTITPSTHRVVFGTNASKQPVTLHALVGSLRNIA